MKGLHIAGSILFGVALIGFGVIQLATQNFLISLLPFKELPLKIVWVNLTSFLFVFCGILLLLQKALAPATAIIVILFSLFFFYPHLTRLVVNMKDPGMWTVAFETLALASGAWLMNGGQNRGREHGKWVLPVNPGRFTFAACLLVFGIQHFMYNEFIITLIPAWLPGKIIWAYLVMLGFFIAAISLLLNKKVGWSMLLLGSVFLVWVLILHAPRSIEKMTDANEWASLCIALAMGGICLYISGSAFYASVKTSSIVTSEMATNQNRRHL